MDEKYVHYGDYIMLYEESLAGYLMSLGFIDESVSVQEVQDLDTTQNVRSMLFQVIPKLSYENAVELRKMLHKTEVPVRNISTRRASMLDKDEAERLDNLQSRKEGEGEVNEKVIQQRSGEPILYGQEIQLRHVASQMMLRAKAENADGDRTCSKLDISEVGGIGCYFKVAAKFKFRQEGDKVVYGDHVFLASVRLDMFLHATEKPIDQTRYSAFRPSTAQTSLDSAPNLYEANLSQNAKSWRFTPYGFYKSDSGYFLKGGDIVRLYHTEKEGFMASEGTDFTQDGLAEVYIRHFADEEDIEAFCCGSLFIIEIAESQVLKGSQCTWTTNEEPTKYRLRHLMTGRLITVIETPTERVLSLAPHSYEVDSRQLKGVQMNSLMTFESTSIDAEEMLRDDEIVKVQLKESVYLAASDDQWIQRHNSHQSHKDNSQGKIGEAENPYFTPIENEELHVSLYKLALKPSATEEDAFSLRTTKPAQMKEIEMILSTKPLLAAFVKSFKRGNEPDRAMYQRLEGVLGRLILFTTESEVKDPFICEGIPYRIRQKYMRELGIIDLLTEILHFPFKSGLHDIRHLKRREPLTRVCQLSYRLIKMSARGYTANEIYCAQWIEMYLDHCAVANEENDLKAESSLVELIDNNKMLLENYIKPKMVEKFINLCIDNERHERYIRLISSLCTSDDEAIIVHQNTICDLMIQETRTFEALMMRIRCREQFIEIEVHEYRRWLDLAEFKNYSDVNDSGRLYGYFLMLLELVAELAFDRNHKADILKTVYSLEIAYACANSPNLGEDIRARFVKIILHLHVNQGDVQRLTVPNYTRLWRDIEAGVEITSARSLLPPAVQEIKKFVYEFLVDTGGSLRAYEQPKNELVKQVLLLVQFMVSHGFYKSSEELSSILDPMICLLDGTCDLITPADIQFSSLLVSPGSIKKRGGTVVPVRSEAVVQNTQRYIEREDNLVMMTCKKIICQTIINVLDIKTDTRISKFLAEFKGNQSNQGSLNRVPIRRMTNSSETSSTFGKRKFTNAHKRLYKKNTDIFSAIVSSSALDSVVDADVKPSLSWLSDILQDEELDLMQASEKDFIAVLLDLVMYKHPALAYDVFQLMLKNFSQRTTLLQYLSNIQLLESEHEVETMQRAKAYLKELSGYAETSEFWLGLNEEEMPSARRMVIFHGASSGSIHTQVGVLISYLINVCCKTGLDAFKDLSYSEPEIEEIEDVLEVRTLAHNTLKSDEISILAEPQKNLFEFIREQSHSHDLADAEPSIFSPGEVPNRENQRLLRNLEAYIPIIALIRYKSQSPEYSREQHFTVLRYCYAFLAKFCRSNPTNQALLFPEVSTFIEDLSNNVLALSLIKEIFRNNSQLLARAPPRLFRQIVKVLGMTPMSWKKCSILSSLTVFMKCDGRVIKSGQAEIMSALSRGDKDTVLKTYSKPEDYADLERMINSVVRNYGSSPSSENFHDISVPEELNYLATLLEVMAVTAEEKISMTELICQNILPLPHFIRLLQISSLYWPLKRALILFFLHVYLDIEFVLQEDEEMFIEGLNTMRDDLAYIIENYTGEGPDYRNSYDRIRFRLHNGLATLKEFALHYAYKVVMPCINQMFMKRGSNFPVERNAETIDAVIDYALQLHSQTDKVEYRNSTIEFLGLVESIDTMSKFVEGRQLPPTGFLRTKSKRTGMTKVFEESSVPVDRDSKAGELSNLIKRMQDLPVVEQAVTLEFEELVFSFMNIQKITTAAFGSNFTLESSHVVSALISLTDPAQTPLSDKMIVMSLRILRKIIEMENRTTSTPSVEWESNGWNKFQGLIEARQNFLAGLNCVKLICDLMINRRDRAIRSEALLCAIAMLLGGNRTVQGKFYEYFGEDRDNGFLTVIKDQLLQYFEKCRRRFSLEILEIEKSIKVVTEAHVQELDDSNMMTTENDDVYIEEAEADEIDEEKLEKYQRGVEYTTCLLRFMQLLCEGHNRDMQNILREQRQDGVLNTKTFDFVNATGGLLATYLKFLHSANLQLGYQLIDTLTEVVQGPCRENQRALSQAKVIVSGRDLLTCLKSRSEMQTRGFDPESSSEEIGELKSKTANFLLSLLEGDADFDILKRISESLDFKRIKERMYEVFSWFVSDSLALQPTETSLTEINNALKKDSFEGGIEEGFNLYILISKISDDYSPAKVNVKETSFTPEQLLAFNFFKMHTGRIEVVIEGLLQCTYFPIQPICKFISEPSKKELMLSVDRESPSNKVIDMLSYATDLINEMNHNEKLGRTKLKVTPEKVSYLRDLGMTIILFINYIILFYYDYEVGDDTKLNVPNEIMQVILALGIAQLALNCLVLIGWYIIRAELVVKKSWRLLIEGRRDKGKDHNEESVQDSFTAAEGRQILMTKGPKAVEFYMDGSRDFVHASVTLTYYIESALMLQRDSTFRYYCVFIIFSVLGLQFHICYSILLLDVVYRFPTLRNVLASVVTNANQLLMTAMLGIIIIYIYSFWGFKVDTDMYYDSAIGTFGESQCQSMWQCFLTTLNVGLRQGGGVADMMVKVPYEELSKYYTMFVFSLTFFIVVTIILLNIIFGIIIDTFAQLRDQKNFIEEDMHTKCFICNIDRYTFDRNSYGFEKHIAEDHNVWQYLYFLVHLQEKDSTEYNGTESYCHKMIAIEDISWIPLHRALCLKSTELKPEEAPLELELKGKIDEMERQMKEMAKIIRSLKKDL
jgi:hypothetical protein